MNIQQVRWNKLSVVESMLKNMHQGKTVNEGLSRKEAQHKLQEHGPNTIFGKKKISAWKIILEQFSDLMILILLASTAISAIMGDITEAITIITIVILNAVLGFIQEYKTEQTMEALKGLAAPTARVIREGNLESIPAEQIVPGDLIVIEAGDRIPADAMLFDMSGLQVDEALLTGESVPVEKALDAGGKKGAHTIGKKNCVYMGTIVTNGRAKAMVYATGMNTEMGKIADMLQNIEAEDTPLQKRLEHLGQLLVFGCLIICAIVAAAGFLRGEPLFDMLLSGISLAVAAIPEGLPAIVTIALAIGVQRMLRKNALIRKLPAVETLGCASVICSDKTGTLTENRMTVRKVYAGDSLFDVKGTGYNKEGIFYINGKEIDPAKNTALKLTLEIGGLCNNAIITRNSGKVGMAFKKFKSMVLKKQNDKDFMESRWEVIGDPTEAALLIAAEKGGLTGEILNNTYFRIDEVPFDSDRKCMSVICDNHKGETLVFTKGAPDIIIEKCSKIYSQRGLLTLNPSDRTKILKQNDEMASEALRVIGVAYRKLESRIYKRKEVENDLIFVGLFGMIDPPRREAVEAVQKCRLAGIKPVMITGDHKITATAIAKELNIFQSGDKVLTGEDLEKMSERELDRVVEDTSVYARVSPRHKLAIVKSLKRQGHIVAMTGDGVNDAPAVKEADIGISMGITGTDVTKEASAMILMDDNFATIVSAVEEGRVIYNNIRKFIRYMLSCNIGEVLTMFLGTLAGLPIPLLPIQILWVNLVTDGLPAIALGFDPAEKDIMMRPPRRAKENIFSNGLLNIILFRGVLIGLSTLAVFVSVMYFTLDEETARTSAFATLVIAQLIHVFECKSERKNIFEIPIFNNVALVLSVICSLIMILGVIYIPIFQRVFKTVPLSINEWSLIMGFTALGPVISSFFRVNKRKY
ncbi:MAG: calcium-translocating P-type ATPase, SERCA-type [Clostridiales bacterium]|jgi:Ca2+-transporting ATPase|nr:calcium-translocating P-type ATPase, SERCA-type [Clostridiales bacterium]